MKLRWFVIATLALGAGVVVELFRRDMDQAYARLEGRSQLVDLPQGRLEYGDVGQGPVVLVAHGSGGGFDQGELIVRAALGPGFRVITPSRFGYLRSPVPAGASFDDQAHAYAALLDHLKVDRVAVLALSHGGPSAALFAALHPDRVSSLTLLSAGVMSPPQAEQAQASFKGDALMRLFQRDGLYWLATRALQRPFLWLMGVDGEVASHLSPAQQALVAELLQGMNPVAPRAAGTVFDNRAAMPGARIAAVRAPTLVVHARDDRLQLFAHAEFAMATIPGAELLAFDRGGHLVLVVEQAAIQTRVRAHVGRHAQGPDARP